MGAAIVTASEVIWAQALGHGNSAQRAELIALSQALRWSKEKSVNINTDSRYMFATAHVPLQGTSELRVPRGKRKCICR